MHVILTHENADFDAVAALLAVHKLVPEAIPVLPVQQNRNVAAFLALYSSGLPYVRRADIDVSQIERITLVDTQRLPQIRGLPSAIPVTVIDHHPLGKPDSERHTITGEEVGSTVTLLVERIQDQAVALQPLEATLLALGVYEDTGSLTYASTTPRDVRVAAWLLERGAALDTIRRFLEPPLNDEQQALFDILLAAAETRVVEGYPIIVAAAQVDNYVLEIAAVAHRLRDTLDPAALFVLVEMPGALHLVCRSTDDAIDVGKIARAFGGGGHERAAAASLHDVPFAEALARLWQQIEQVIQPAARVADLMSHGVQTLDADKRLADVIGRMRRIGHEGFPVVRDGTLVGLLTRRDADRAVEHGLGKMTVAEVMTAGKVTLRPDDSVARLEQTMVESGWGQIPVVDDQDRLIGVVTRTDLIKHWARRHPVAPQPEPPALDLAEIEDVLGSAVARLIDAVAACAMQSDLALYLVGGVVRDLLLRRRNLDLDFVVEGEAIQLAHALRDRHGGTVSSYRPFGTARWKLDASVARALDLDPAELPDHVDFATARNEFYEHPTALPTVYRGSIKLDLGRRDFTMNTLAVQFSPAGAKGRILDFYGGIRDLRNGIIRVLHNLSFVDDPTRILRAVRFEYRLGFTIEPRTADLMQTARPMLRRITGERLRNELNLLLREHEPEHGLLAMQERGFLSAIHPGFAVSANLPELFDRARRSRPPWPMPEPDIVDLYWHVIGASIELDQLPAVLDRLLFPHALAASIQQAARVVQEIDGIGHPDARPSQIDARLKDFPDLALYTAWLICDSPLVRGRVERYVTEWRSIRPEIDGHALKARGLKPGPCFSLILNRLRAARLDGEVTSVEDEQALVDSMLAQGVCHDSA